MRGISVSFSEKDLLRMNVLQCNCKSLSPLSRRIVRRFKDRSETHQDERRGRFKELDRFRREICTTQGERIAICARISFKIRRRDISGINGETDDRGDYCRIWNTRGWLLSFSC